MAKDTVALIKDRLSIVDIVSPYVKLTRAGKSLRGLCPFHKEKTPSFHVSPERGTYHCFGCGEGGDGFSFIEKVEGIDFKDALKLLAEKAGVPVEYDPVSSEHRSRIEKLRALMARASDWYAHLLPGSAAEAYALERGLSAKTLQTWGIGAAPDSWRALLEALSAEGHTLEELRAAGLVKEADGKPGTYYDRFRNRLMFPIRDASGKVVGFTGRALAKDEPAKYLNSPETDLYHKSEILFGMDRAKDAIRSRGFTLLVEGQMDVILAHQADFQNVVALSGTALSERHLALMKRYSDNLMLALDADAAGLSATAKSAMLALSLGMHVKAVRLPSGKDPADLISEDVGEFSRRLKEAKPIVDFFLAVLVERERDPHRLLGHVERIVLPLLAAVQSPMEREHFVQSVAQALALSPEAVRESVARVRPQAPDTARAPSPAAPVPAGTKLSPRETRGLQLLSILHTYPGTPLAERIEAEYCRITEARELPSEALPEHLLFQAERMLGEDPAADAVDELLHAFEETVIREAYQEAVATLRRAEAAHDASAIREAQATCAALSNRLARIGH